MSRIRPDPRTVHAALLICLGGCGGPRDGAVYPASGTLTVGGRPAANANVASHPVEPVGGRAALSVATTGADGTYRLTTYAIGDGAPAGEYAVTVVWPDDSHPRDECEDVVTRDRFEGRYAEPARSPWRVTVGPGSNDAMLRMSAPPVAPGPGRSTPGPASIPPSIGRPSR